MLGFDSEYSAGHLEGMFKICAINSRKIGCKIIDRESYFTRFSEIV